MKTKMTEFEIVKRAIENTQDIYGDILEDMIVQSIQFNEEIDLGANGTSLEFEKNTYDLQNILKLQDELLEHSFIEWIKVVEYDDNISFDVSYEHELSTYDSLLFENYVYAKLDYGF